MPDAAVAERIEPTDFQARVLALPEDYDLFLGAAAAAESHSHACF